MSEEHGMHAWVDESVHTDAPPSGMYVLASVICDASRVAELVRAEMRSLVPRPRRRLHWKDEDEATKAKIVQALADLEILSVVVVRSEVDAKRQERARRKCMERLLFELAGQSTSCVWLESRQEKLNREDIRMVDALRSQSTIPRSLRVEFARPMEEPMLWVPDAIAGAVAASRKADRADLRMPLDGIVEEIDV